MSSEAKGESFILFELAGATYALRSENIQQLEMIGAVTPVPNAPPYVDGVVSVRGQVIPALNLRARFGFARKAPDMRSRLVVVRAEGRAIGLVVDSAREFASISADMIQPPPAGVAGLSGNYLQGTAQLGERLVLLLDVAQLIEAPEAGEIHTATADV
ncbi:MAG TPA: chemotaxis protein CheW [Longimicrobiales bacterium]